MKQILFDGCSDEEFFKNVAEIVACDDPRRIIEMDQLLNNGRPDNRGYKVKYDRVQQVRVLFKPWSHIVSVFSENPDDFARSFKRKRKIGEW